MRRRRPSPAGRQGHQTRCQRRKRARLTGSTGQNGAMDSPTADLDERVIRAVGQAPWSGPPSAPFPVVQAAEPQRSREWRWVEQWRAERESPAWGPGITVAIFIAALTAVALVVLTQGLAHNGSGANGASGGGWLAVGVNVVIAGGMAPALWLSRDLPVLRFLAAGAAAGLVAGWIWLLLTMVLAPQAPAGASVGASVVQTDADRGGQLDGPADGAQPVVRLA